MKNSKISRVYCVRNNLTEEINQIVNEFEVPLLRYATRILRSSTVACDIVQEVFIKYVRYRQEGTKDSIQNVKAWLYRVTNNLALDHIRKHQRLEELDEDMVKTLSHSNNGNPASLASKKDAESVAWGLLETLNDREKQIVLLKVVERKSYQDIANIMEISSSNVGFILHTALKKLARLMRGKLA